MTSCFKEGLDDIDDRKSAVFHLSLTGFGMTGINRSLSRIPEHHRTTMSARSFGVIVSGKEIPEILFSL